MKLGVVGGGVVGRATARCFIEHVDDVRVYDTVRERCTHSVDDVLACDLVKLCLPTPQHKDSLECDVSKIEDFLSGVAGSMLHATNLVIRSTVPVGFTRKMSDKYNLPNLCHSPEFLTARCSITDAQLPARNIVGTASDRCGFSPCWKLLSDLYCRRFPGVACILASSDESELIKLATNGFFATKIAYFNEVRGLSDALELNWDVVLAGILSDGRISHSHTQVPGPDGKRGFGGACLPKDLANLVTCLRDAEQIPHVTSQAYARNLKDRTR